MKIVGPLMKEHRLIERMVYLVKLEVDRLKNEKGVNVDFIHTVIDFFRTYADRCHHGKEEDILFRELKKKKLSDKHQKTMNELIEDHKKGRQYIKELECGYRNYLDGDPKEVCSIRAALEEIIRLYPQHIDKEDKHFFLEVMDYFSNKENQSLLGEENKFDQNIIHEKYKSVVENFENKN
jgi:hemerythrin-like domain-containing protein